jgi:hypothetical protein
LPADVMYDVIEVAHLAVDHAGCNRLLKRTGKKYIHIAIAIKTCCCPCVNFVVLRRQRGNEADFEAHFA